MPLLIKGNITLVVNGQHIEVSGITPYLGIPPDAIEDAIINKSITYCLTIENLSSFNSYTRTIDDGGIIVYSNGFPGSKWQLAYKKILQALPMNVSIFHWGDIDIGGFRILQKLQEYATEVNPDLRIHSHLMGNKDIILKDKEFSFVEKRSLQRMLKSYPSLIQRSADIPFYKQEQEALIPIPPKIKL